MHKAKGLLTLAALLSFSAVTYAASGLPGDTSSGMTGQSATGGQSADQKQLEKQRRDQGIGTSGDLPMQDKGVRPENPPADPSKTGRVKDEQIMLGSANPTVKGEVLRIEGDKYTVKDQAGTEVSLIVNQNTRMDCGQGGSLSNFQPKEQTATDRPIGQGDQLQGRSEQKQKEEGKLQDLSRTNEQPGSDVGKSTGAASSSSQAACAFKPGDKIEAEVSDMGAATMIKAASDKSKGSDGKGIGGRSQ